MRLLKVELSRLFSRRAVLVVMILGALAVGAVAVGTLYEHRPVSDAEIQRAQVDADRFNDDPYIQRRLAQCMDGTADVQRCEDRYLTKPEYLLYRQQLRPEEFRGWVLPMAGIIAAAGLLLGATFIGADIASGSLGTQLLFQPSRWKVWTAKAAAVVLGTSLFAGASLAVSNGAIWLVARAWDQPTTSEVLGDYSAAVGRGVVFAAAAAVAGYAVALLARHTAAALGLLAVYGIAAEAVLRAVWSGSERWLLSNHVAAFIGGPFRREVYSSCNDFSPCQSDTLRFTTVYSALYLGVLLVLVVAASWLVFRRRDVP